MVPSGAPTEDTVQALGGLLEPDDVIIDGGNTNFHDDVRRAAELNTKQIHYMDAGNQRRHLGTTDWLLPDDRGRSKTRTSA